MWSAAPAVVLHWDLKFSFCFVGKHPARLHFPSHFPKQSWSPTICLTAQASVPNWEVLKRKECCGVFISIRHFQTHLWTCLFCNYLSVTWVMKLKCTKTSWYWILLAQAIPQKIIVWKRVGIEFILSGTCGFLKINWQQQTPKISIKMITLKVKWKYHWRPESELNL